MDVTGHLPDLRFEGVSDTGVRIDQSAFRGRTTLVYFGFTHCVEGCPIILARLARLVAEIDPQGKHVRILMVSLDPRQDTPVALHAYLGLFDAARSVGLTGTDSTIESMARRYRVAFRASGPGEVDPHLPHSNATYVFDATGRARLLISPTDPEDRVEAALGAVMDKVPS